MPSSLSYIPSRHLSPSSISVIIKNKYIRIGILSSGATSLMKSGNPCLTFPLAGTSIRSVGWH